VTEFGAKYDGRMKSWYVPDGVVISIFNPFIPLSIELVPASNWESNVRSEFKDDWKMIKSAVYKKAGYRCEICGGQGDAHPVEAHEVWSYNNQTGIQKLEYIISLCPSCHKAKHIGLAMVNGEAEAVKKHILKVNNWKMEDLDKYINEAFYLFDKRSSIKWTLDLSYIKDNFHM
jgi:hypothetical protein